MNYSSIKDIARLDLNNLANSWKRCTRYNGLLTLL